MKISPRNASEEVQDLRQSPVLDLAFIWHVLFRRKWLIVGCSLLGIAGATAVWHFVPRQYRSEAKLLVRYVVDNRIVSPQEAEQVQSPGTEPEGIVNSEVEILKSWDLFTEVARDVGPEKILSTQTSGDDGATKAAELISKGLSVESSPKNAVINVAFNHSQATIAQDVLKRLIDRYYERHMEVHRGLGGVDELLAKQRDESRERLKQYENDLRKLKSQAGVLSLDEAKRGLSEQMSKLRQAMFEAEAELAEQQALFKKSPATVTNAAVAASAKTNPESGPSVPDEIMAKYKMLLFETDALRSRSFELRFKSQLSDENPLVKAADSQLAEADAGRKKLLAEYPGLAPVVAPQAIAPVAPVSAAPVSEVNRTEALQAKLAVLNTNMNRLRQEVPELQDLEGAVAELQRHRDVEEAKLRHLNATLEQSRFNDTIGASRNSSISIVQAPSPALPAQTKRIKWMALAVIAGIGMGLALAFLWEMFIDRRIKRPVEINTRLGLPLMLSIPDLSRGHCKLLEETSPAHESTAACVLASATPRSFPAEFFAGYAEALRDQVTMYFRNVARKPKLIGITSCSSGAGATTTTVALAALLSETGDGRVLIVDMNRESGSVQEFFGGRPFTGLKDVLDGADESALVAKNLYGARLNNNGDRGLPGKVVRLLPRLQASDYDYIVFDMPRLSQTSITNVFAPMLDLTILMIEAERVQRDTLERTTGALIKSGAKIGVVMNKVQTHVPEFLDAAT